MTKVQFSPLTDWITEGHDGSISRDPLPVFSAGGRCKQFRHGQEYSLFDIVHRAFPLPTTASPTLKGALKDGFGETSAVCDMLKSRSIDYYGISADWTFNIYISGLGPTETRRMTSCYVYHIYT